MNGILTRFRRRLMQLALGGTASIVAAAVVSNILRIVSSITLTRLLDAQAFGVVGIITSVATIFALISDIGVQPFVIRHALGADRGFLDEIWTLRLIRSFILGLCMVIASGPIAILLGKPEFALVLAVWSVSFLIDGLSSMSFATAVREHQLWRLTGLELVAAAFQLVAAISFALILRSYWALIFAMICSSMLKCVLSYALFPRAKRRIALNRARALELWTFSRFIAPSSLMTLLIMQTDKVVLARFMTLAAYGIYAVAATLSAAAPALASNYGRRVLYPAFAAIARTAPETLRETFYRKRRWPNLLYMAANGAIAGGASLIVTILYDSRYQPVAIYLRLLTISSALALANISAEEMLIATGRLRATLHANIVRMGVLIVGICLVFATGRSILLVAAFGAMELVAMLSYWWSMRRAGLFMLREEVWGLAVACLAAGLAYGASLTALPYVNYFQNSKGYGVSYPLKKFIQTGKFKSMSNADEHNK